MIAVASSADFVRSLGTAHQVALTSYTLRPGPVLAALTAAARRGADVRVRLERDPFDDPSGALQRSNVAALAALRAAGARADATGPNEPVLHMKAAVVDGTAWLDDRNWTGGAERIIRDSEPADVAAVTAAVAGGPGADPQLETTKAGAQRLEADVIAGAGSAELEVESESFGNGAIYDALLRRALEHEPTRLLVAGREVAEPAGRLERAHLARLAALGVDVRVGNPGHDLDEKLAVTETNGWVGSANATYAHADSGRQRDWGLATRQTGILDDLRAAFERNWNAARSFDAGVAAVVR